jgi:hypothetical protein
MYVKFSEEFSRRVDAVVDVMVTAKNLDSAINKAQKKLQKDNGLSYGSSNYLEHSVIGYF